MSDQSDDQPRVFREGGIVPGHRGEVRRVLYAGEEVLSLTDPRHRDDEEPT